MSLVNPAVLGLSDSDSAPHFINYWGPAWYKNVHTQFLKRFRYIIILILYRANPPAYLNFISRGYTPGTHFPKMSQMKLRILLREREIEFVCVSLTHSQREKEGDCVSVQKTIKSDKGAYM